MSKDNKIDEPPDFPQDERDDWPVEIFIGAKWGFIAGCAAGLWYIQAHTIPSLGFYPGDAGLVLVPTFVAGAAIGAVIGWVYYYLRGPTDPPPREGV